MRYRGIQSVFVSAFLSGMVIHAVSARTLNYHLDTRCHVAAHSRAYLQVGAFATKQQAKHFKKQCLKQHRAAFIERHGRFYAVILKPTGRLRMKYHTHAHKIYIQEIKQPKTEKMRYDADVSTFSPRYFLTKKGHPVFQVGGFIGSQGKTQQVNIEDLIGDTYTVTNHHDGNLLLGLGYLLDGKKTGSFRTAYGLNLYYLTPTTVSGTITQEQLYTNLSYQYDVTHLPLYATVKGEWLNSIEKYGLTVDAGMGPNFMKISGYQDTSLDSVTVPDHAFSGGWSTQFSAMAGVGLKTRKLFGYMPLECGYKFFYLGSSSLQPRTDQVLSNLLTGNSYAQAIACTASI